MLHADAPQATATAGSPVRASASAPRGGDAWVMSYPAAGPAWLAAAATPAVHDRRPAAALRAAA